MELNTAAVVAQQLHVVYMHHGAVLHFAYCLVVFVSVAHAYANCSLRSLSLHTTVNKQIHTTVAAIH
jgi:hypothetical protein